jgi:hypothetical protein
VYNSPKGGVVMPSYYDYDDYESVANDSDELYSYDDDNQWDEDDIEHTSEWENYYHNIANELSEE